MEKVETVQLEKSILDWFCVKFPVLKKQFSCLNVVQREYSGKGFFIYFGKSGDEIIPAVDRAIHHLDGPHIQSPDLNGGAGSVLFLENGIVKMLEIYAYNDFFPQELSSFSIL